MQKFIQRLNIIVFVSIAILAMITGSVLNSKLVNAAPPQWQSGNVTQVTAGNEATCALANGAAYCWGSNANGQLGNGTTDASANPVAVSTSGALAGKTITQISSGYNFTCAVANGAAYCWGDNTNGQLGNGTPDSSSFPVAVNTSGVLAGKSVTQVSAGVDFACALAAGNAYCWGTANSGQLGNNSYGVPPSSFPVAVNTSGVLAGKTISQLSTGNDHTCVIASGKVYCWGVNVRGQLGDGGDITTVPVAVDTNGVLAGKTVTQVSAGGGRTCAVANNAAYCWGDNFYGELGNATEINSGVPVAVDASGALSGKTITSISTGLSHTCALAGAVYCWGYNDTGLLGDGTDSNSNIPVATISSGTLAGKEVTQVATGYTQTCTVATGGAYCWGSGVNGTLGDGTASVYVNRRSPVYVSTRPADSSDRKITNVSFSLESGKKIMTVSGEYMVNEPNPREYQKGMTGQSLVSINGEAISFCTEGTGYSSAFLTGYGIVGSTDSNPCYYLVGGGMAPVITDKTARVHLSNAFDMTAPGSVSVNGSAVYQFNDNSGSSIESSVVVNNEPLGGMPTISKRPTFSGTAEPGSLVTVTVHSDPVSCTTTAGSDGSWSCTLPSDLEPGQHTVNVRVVAPGNIVTDLGPYSVTVPGATTITNQTPLAPMTGEQRIAAIMSPQVLLVAAGAVFTLTIILNMGYQKIQSLRVRPQKTRY